MRRIIIITPRTFFVGFPLWLAATGVVVNFFFPNGHQTLESIDGVLNSGQGLCSMLRRDCNYHAGFTHRHGPQSNGKYFNCIILISTLNIKIPVENYYVFNLPFTSDFVAQIQHYFLSHCTVGLILKLHHLKEQIISKFSGSIKSL
jgi:hypothetical protein